MTREYKDIAQVYQSLTDEEILDDRIKPFASISVPGLCKVTIKSVSDWEYYHVLIPLRNTFFSIYASEMSESKDIENNEQLLDRMRMIVNEISAIKTLEDIEKKAATLSCLFDIEKGRRVFFKAMKQMKIIPWWVSFRKWERRVTRMHNITIFCMVWAVNFDGVKKNARQLLAILSSITKSDSHIVSSNSGDWDGYKKRLMEASIRNRRELATNSKSSTT